MKEHDRQPNWDRIDRAISKEKRELLMEKNVAIIGVGSLGSEITRLLTIAGVGKFTLVDPDTLDSSNVLRHWADLREIDTLKVRAVKKLIKLRNPNAEVKAIAQDARKASRYFGGVDLAIITGLGSNGPQFQIAETLRQKGITTLESAIYDKGEGGEVFIIRPNEGPCYACFSTFLNRSIDAEVRNGKIYCANVRPEEVPSFPALAVHINRIATIAAEFAIEQLKDPDEIRNQNKNLIIFSNKKILLGKRKSDGREIYLEPLSAASYAVPKRDDCLICGSNNVLSDIPLEELIDERG